MPFSGPKDPKLSKRIKNLSVDKRQKWVDTWNSVFADSGDEGKAFAVANAAIKEDEVDAKEIAMRRLYLAPPHGKLIAEGKKTTIVLPRKQDGLIGEPFLLTSGQFVYGWVCIAEGEQIEVGKFASCFEQHRITERERARWWPDCPLLWSYGITANLSFPVPQRWVPPAGIGLLGEIAYSREHCMLCEEKPYFDVLWAGGVGRAWFCDEHWRWWIAREENADDVVGYKIRQGLVPELYREHYKMHVNYGLEWQ